MSSKQWLLLQLLFIIFNIVLVYWILVLNVYANQKHIFRFKDLTAIAEEDINKGQWELPALIYSHQKALKIPSINWSDLSNSWSNNNSDQIHLQTTVHIWSKAGIGLYLWQHILEQQVIAVPQRNTWEGTANIHGLNFSFEHGHGVTLDSLSIDSSHVVLVLNARSRSLAAQAARWLRRLRTLPRLHYAQAIILGSEQCVNEWVLPFLKERGGPLNRLYLVYDALEVNNRTVFQFPLGVATYRGVPFISPENISCEYRRQWRCVFSGTVYHNSSRELLASIVHEKALPCHLRVRAAWSPAETKDSLEQYLKELRSADVILSPAGLNIETYRIYEALQFGSTPVIVSDTRSTSCPRSGLRLAQQYQLPLIRLDSWHQLPDLLESFNNRTRVDEEKLCHKARSGYKLFRARVRREWLTYVKSWF